jgi:hypothetical protein
MRNIGSDPALQTGLTAWLFGALMLMCIYKVLTSLPALAEMDTERAGTAVWRIAGFGLLAFVLFNMMRAVA